MSGREPHIDLSGGGSLLSIRKVSRWQWPVEPVRNVGGQQKRRFDARTSHLPDPKIPAIITFCQSASDPWPNLILNAPR
jgi:hypothetical protein